MNAPHFDTEHVTVWHGDCIDVMRGLPANSVDSVVCDPPYGLEFMGKDWDSFKPAAAHAEARTRRSDEMDDENKRRYIASGVNTYAAGRPFQAWCEEWATEALRVLKPGGYLAAFGGTRTYHRLTCGIEDAGFEIRDSIGYGHSLLAWAYGSGFPKSLNVSKALADLPACTCSGTGAGSERISVVNAGSPTGTVRAGAGTEPGSVPLAGLPADCANRVGPDMSADATRRLPSVDALDIDGIGASLPVVLRPAAVAGSAERDEVSEGVRGVEVDPEALRDQMVGELGCRTAVLAGAPITADHPGGDAEPLSALVLPLPSTPSRVVGAGESVPVSNRHAGPGAVVSHVGPAAELGAADDADVDAVPGASHGLHDATERLSKCPACGGRRGQIPEGLGTALKPAWEPIVLARKPTIGTVAANVLQHGTGALNIDASRIDGGTRPLIVKTGDTAPGSSFDTAYSRQDPAGTTLGRWPANVVLDASQAAALDQQSGVLTSGANPTRRSSDKFRDTYGEFKGQTEITPARGADSGGASRFFKTVDDVAPRFMYTAKAGSDERPGVDGVSHPTVKPVDLMRWLVRLVTPKGGTVLEPFAGSGTTVEAAVLEGFRCIAIEREADYLPLIMQRVSKPHAVGLDLDFETPAPAPVSVDNGRRGEASAARRYTEKGGTNFAPLPGRRRDERPPRPEPDPASGFDFGDWEDVS